ncbi:MAG: SDR family NAD(P)-dependent oxidoreductase [Rhizobiales bacterium]|nr:SDR family NAD(P)-dependent oxidoreductase [Hyphomicrobiales bacterium]
MAAWKHAWITGASSGIGAELSVRLATSGTTVSASARSAENLQALSQSQDGIHSLPLDVCDQEAVAAAVEHAEHAHGPIDLAILNAGIWLPSEPHTFDGEAATRSMEVNYLGVTHALAALLPEMKRRKIGHIAIVASVAGYRGLPKGAYYAPTKAALINLAETLHPELAKEGIKLQVINPGFIRTPMTQINKFPMPFLMEVPEAVTLILKGLHANRFEIAFPWQLVSFLKVSRVLPHWLYFWMVRRLAPRE